MANEKSKKTVHDSAGEQSYELLPGTPYSRYALPLDYKPSRHYAPRWGRTQGPIPELYEWFSAHAAEYRGRLARIREAAKKLQGIPIQFDAANLPTPAWGGVPYAPFDSVALYWMVQEHRPRRYVEIGSGITTCFAYRAITDAQLSTQIVSIDPEPRAMIDKICDETIRQPLETVDLAVFETLDPGDILFFDGSHRVYMNSDVTVFMIDVLPRLKPGVVVHVHDIHLPWDYPEMFQNWYWSEQYILAVYLMASRDRVDPLLPTKFLCQDPAFRAEQVAPLLDLGPLNAGWRGGGAMWFTHTS